MIHLTEIHLKTSAKTKTGFPFTLPLVRNFERIEFRTPVTFFVGENGSGKSTLLEAVAAGVNAVAIGGEDIARDKTLAPARDLGRQMRFIWHSKTRHGFFLRAEDFFNFARRMQQSMAELQEIADGFEKEYSGYGLDLARGSVLSQRRALIEKYGDNPDGNSHGESFLKIFQARFVPNGLYLLDEPEAPLSPQRQLAFLLMIAEMVDQGAQFIIATHSPILMAYPEAVIYNFDKHPVREAAFDEVEHVSLTRAFLKNPEGI
ncbi:MAG: AAA family ATPase [Acidobacteria bacterium]|nr:AAA family ATPase [Acidobacteriota bacterium]